MIAQYDAAIMDYWQTIQRADGQPWSANTAQYYRQVYFRRSRRWRANRVSASISDRARPFYSQ